MGQITPHLPDPCPSHNYVTLGFLGSYNAEKSTHLKFQPEKQHSISRKATLLIFSVFPSLFKIPKLG